MSDKISSIRAISNDLPQNLSDKAGNQHSIIQSQTDRIADGIPSGATGNKTLLGLSVKTENVPSANIIERYKNGEFKEDAYEKALNLASHGRVSFDRSETHKYYKSDFFGKMFQYLKNDAAKYDISQKFETVEYELSIEERNLAEKIHSEYVRMVNLEEIKSLMSELSGSFASVIEDIENIKTMFSDLQRKYAQTYADQEKEKQDFWNKKNNTEYDEEKFYESIKKRRAEMIDMKKQFLKETHIWTFFRKI